MKTPNPVFMVSVPNKNKDHFGSLTLRKDHIHFRPLNPYLQGEFDYGPNESLARTHTLEFKLNYFDISDEEPVIMPMPSTEDQKLDDFPINFNCQFTLFRTGNYKFIKKQDDLDFIDSFKKDMHLGIATCVVKIPNFGLTGKKRNNDEREGIANLIFSEMMRKKGQYESEMVRKGVIDTYGVNTSISTFDILYENILPELEEQEGSKIQNVDKKLDTLKRVFGYTEIKSVKNIANQCLFSLDFTFPEIGKQVSMEEIANRRGGFLHDYLLLDQSKEIFNAPSKILSIDSALKVRENIPYYLRGECWRLLYCSSDDGASIVT